MPKTNEKTEIKLLASIRPGPTSPAQKQAWKRFWTKLVSQLQEEVNHGKNAI